MMISLPPEVLALRESPLTWLLLTLAIFRGCQWLSAQARFHPVLNPMLWTTIVLIALLKFSGTAYQAYMQGGQYLHFLLGPATVALAVPLYAQLNRLGRAFVPLLTTLLCGGLIGIISGVAVGYAFGLQPELLLSLAPRSVTTPIAMGIAEHNGGIPQLAAAFVILTGMLACLITLPLLKPLGLDNELVLGFSSGLAGHGIATARAFQISPSAGAFAGLAMGLNGLITALIMPILVKIFITF